MTSTEPTFVGQRLRLARAFTGTTQEKLAAAIAVSKPYVSQLESGAKPPSEMTLAAIAAELGFEPAWFCQPVQFNYAGGEGHFRCSKKATAETRHRLTSQAVLCDELVAYFGTQMRLYDDRFPRIEARTTEEIDRAAERCRMQWGLGADTPVKNVYRTVELAGAVITTADDIDHEVDAFSRRLCRPIIVMSTSKNSSSRNVFDIAHECAHLVLHSDSTEYSEEVEQQAHRFASTFLMPRVGLFREFPRGANVDLDALVQLKARWRVSVAAMVRRALEMGIITASQYARAYRELGVRGWLKGEPGEFKADTPEALRSCLNLMHKRHGMTWADVARHVGWSVGTLQKIASYVEPPTVDTSADVSRVIAISSARPRVSSSSDARLDDVTGLETTDPAGG